MIVVDTNVLSEMMRPSPSPVVRQWLDMHYDVELFFTAVSEAEIRIGLATMPSGRRRESLLARAEIMIHRFFANRVLVFDSNAALAYAAIGARRKAAGTPIATMDCQIAAIARSKGAAVATRDVSDFEECSIEIINPWDYTP